MSEELKIEIKADTMAIKNAEKELSQPARGIGGRGRPPFRMFSPQIPLSKTF